MKAVYGVIPATLEHIEPIARTVRQADVDECWAAAMMTIRDALTMSLAGAAIARVGTADGVPGVIYGVTNIGPRNGQIWMIGTTLIDRHQRGFLEHSLTELDDFQQSYDCLWNYVDVRNKRAVRWLKWLGFSFEGPVSYGPMEKPFYYFSWQRCAQEIAA